MGAAVRKSWSKVGCVRGKKLCVGVKCVRVIVGNNACIHKIFK